MAHAWGVGRVINIGLVAGALAACAATKQRPSDTTCNQMRADPQGRVDVLLGCKTIIIVE